VVHVYVMKVGQMFFAPIATMDFLEQIVKLVQIVNMEVVWMEWMVLEAVCVTQISKEYCVILVSVDSLDHHVQHVLHV